MRLSKETFEKQKQERLGEIRKNNFGTEMKIVEYNGYSDIVVEFQDEYKTRVHTTYQNFKKGEVKNPYDKTVCGMGYIGKGKYKVRGKDGKYTKVYEVWHSMIKRCYDPYYINKRPTYIDCYVCDEWLCFQNFAKWFYENYYEIENQKMCLDKDILYKGNKVYSPQTCVFAPNNINVLFVKRQNDRGEYPIGVYCYERTNMLKVQCNIYVNNKMKKVGLGYFSLNKPFQAFYAYKIFKEAHIKQVADEYKDLIPDKLYEALYKWEVEIND